MTDHLTTDPASGHFAGEWHRLPDGTPQFFTVEHVRHMARLNTTAQAKQLAADEVRGLVQEEALFQQRNFGRAREMHHGICKVCETPFQSMSSVTVTCSEECRVVRNREAKRARDEQARRDKQVTRTCIVTSCGKSFTTHDLRQKTCSDSCRVENTREVRRQRQAERDKLAAMMATSAERKGRAA